MKIAFPLFSIILLTGCTRETVVYSTCTFYNKSSQTVKFFRYRVGELKPEYNVSLKAGRDTVMQVRGEGAMRVTFDAVFPDADSIQVWFGTDVLATHYGYRVVGKNKRAINADNPRSLFNKETALTCVSTRPKKHVLKSDCSYTFSEQDYLDAK